MPTYQYACTACGHELEVVQSFTDASLSECPECQGRLRKQFSAVGVVFKGSGFYRTDSRPKSSSETSSGEKAASEKSPSEKSSSEKSTAEKSSSSAAPAGASTSSASSSSDRKSSTSSSPAAA